MENPPSANTFRLHIGAAYYPEHWPEERWPEDIQLMKEAGLSVVRVGEFAWSTFEPSEGSYHFEWMDRAIQMLADNGISTVMGTPTAAPPAWLCYQYPTLMRVEENGRRVQFGNRAHYCVNSPEYHQATHNLVSAMAEHFGSNPNIIGWQIDNEFSTPCYCEHCTKLFQQYLAEKYGTLDELNSHWSTAYWSQTYSDWSQIPLPIGAHNPGLMLEYKRFFSIGYRNYQKLQIDLLRPHLRPEVWITHNFMGWFDRFDHYKQTEDLDMASWDWYIGTGHNNYVETNSIHDLTRGFKKKNFWVMETQPGSVNWAKTNNMLYKGEARTMAWQAVARGADGFLYWQWRSALGGQEQYHGSLVDPSGQPRPFYADVKQIAKEFAQISPLLEGSTVSSRVAILNDYESQWSIQWQTHQQNFNYVEHLKHYYRPCAANNISVDIITPSQPLNGYKLVIAPALVLLDENKVANIKDFVSSGGILILTARTAMKDEYNALYPSRQPGPLCELCGVEVEEYYALDEDVPVKGNWFEGTSRCWAELLKISDPNFTLTVAKYGPSNGWLDGQPAITVRGYRSGLVYYVGAYLDETSQMAFLTRILENTGNRNPFPTPPGVEVSRRTDKNGDPIYFLINHNRISQSVQLPWKVKEHFSNQELHGKITLSPYAVGILTKIPE